MELIFPGGVRKSSVGRLDSGIPGQRMGVPVGNEVMEDGSSLLRPKHFKGI